MTDAEDKLTWQVRDTCRRAERAECLLALASGASLADWRKVKLMASAGLGSCAEENLAWELFADIHAFAVAHMTAETAEAPGCDRPA